MAGPLLATWYSPWADVTTRYTWEWARAEHASDFVWPMALAAAWLAWNVYWYWREGQELSRRMRWTLTLLRTMTIAGLLWVFLQPQWHVEQDVTRNSRVLVLVDTSLSMGLENAPGSSLEKLPTRAERAADLLAATEFLPQLRRRHDVTVLRFDQELIRIAQLPKQASTSDDTRSLQAVNWRTALAPVGLETRLGQALRQVLEEERAAPLAGLVLLTDGGQNAGLNPTSVVPLARSLRVPIYPIGLGSDRQPPNVRVSDLVAPARAYPGDTYTVTGYVQAQGMAGQNVSVELSSRPATTTAPAEGTSRTEGSQQVTLDADGIAVAVRFDLVPQEVGTRTFLFEVQPVAGESDPADNRQEVDVEVVDRKTRVLLVAGGPTREYQFLRNHLFRDRETLLDIWLQTAGEGVSQEAQQILASFPATREALFSYDCILALDPDWLALDVAQMELLEQWVAEQAGGLIVVPGPVHTDRWNLAPQAAPLRNLYPVDFEERLAASGPTMSLATDPRPLEFSREGLQADFLWLGDSSAASQQAWALFAGVYGPFPLRGPKPGATVYARLADPRLSNDAGAGAYLVEHFYGSGRVFYLGSGEMWRLRRVDEAYFEQFYTKLVRHVAQGRLVRGSNRGVLLVDHDRYLLGQTVQVRATLKNAQLEPLADATVPLHVTAPDRTLETISLTAEPARPGNFLGQFTVRQEGSYRLDLSVPGNEDQPLTRRLQSQVPDLERQNPRRNDALLSELAEATNGRGYVGIEAALGSGGQPLHEQIAERSQTVVLSGTPLTLWDRPWVLAWLAGCLCLEWFLRRWSKIA